MAVNKVFWDVREIIFIDYLEKGKTINGEYYVALLQCLREEIKEKCPHMVKKKVLFHHDNVPAHTSMIEMSKLHDLCFKLLPHPLYSSDLDPQVIVTCFPISQNGLEDRDF